MPRRDGTGPMGRGSMSGKGLGLCTGENVGGIGARMGQGFGRGRGLGAGNVCRRSGGLSSGDATGVNEKELLLKEKENLQKRLETVSIQLEKLSECEK